MLYAKHCASHWEYKYELDRDGPAPHEVLGEASN